MNTPTSICAWFIWCLLWAMFVAHDCSRRDGEALVRSLANLLPAFVAVTSTLMMIVIPLLTGVFVIETRWIHHAAFTALFVFLLAGQTLQIEGWMKLRRQAPESSVVATYRRLWCVTELMPAPAALAIFISGLGLIVQGGMMDPAASNVANYSLRSGWLFLLVASFGFFFWDGILGYLPATREMHRHWTLPASQRTGRFIRPWRDAVLALHFVSFPVVFVFGTLRLPSWNPLADVIRHCEESLGFLRAGLPQAIVAFGVWLLMGALVWSFRWAAKHQPKV
jgi:hypothetical protein